MTESMAHVPLVTFVQKDYSQNVPLALINQTKVAKAKMIANSVQLVGIVVQKGWLNLSLVLHVLLATSVLLALPKDDPMILETVLR